MLDEWSDKWSLGLNFEKCKIMHFGANNEKYPYYLKKKSSITRNRGFFSRKRCWCIY